MSRTTGAGTRGSVKFNKYTHTHTHTHKEAGREAHGTQGLSKNCTSRESVSPLSRLVRGFRNKYHGSSQMRVTQND